MGVKLVGSAILAFGACLVIWPIDPFMSQSHAGVSSISYSRDGGQRRNIQLLISSGRLFRVSRSYILCLEEDVFMCSLLPFPTLRGIDLNGGAEQGAAKK